MKLTISQPVLAGLLQRGAAVAAKNSPSAIYNHVRLVAENGRLHVASTDGDRFDATSGPAMIDSDGGTTVSAAALSALVARYPSNKDVTLELLGDRLRVKCSRSDVKLATLPVDDFPTWADWPGKAEFTLSPEALVSLFGRTVGCAAPHGPLNVMLQGVNLSVAGDRLRAIATDTHKLARIEIDLPPGAEGLPSIIVSPQTIDAAFKVLKGAAEIAVKVTESTITFTGGDVTLASKLVDATYPDTTPFLSLEANGSMTVSRAEVSACLDRAILTTEEGVSFSHVSIVPGADGFLMKARNGRGGEHVEVFEVEGGEDIRPFGFNPAVFGHVLGLIEGDSVTIQQVGPKGHHYVFDEDDPTFFGLFMPVTVGVES